MIPDRCEAGVRKVLTEEYERRRVKRFDFTPEVLLHLSRAQHYAVVENPLPDDARVVGALYDHDRHTFVLLVHSATYAPVPEYERIPDAPLPVFCDLPLEGGER